MMKFTWKTLQSFLNICNGTALISLVESTGNVLHAAISTQDFFQKYKIQETPHGTAFVSGLRCTLSKTAVQRNPLQKFKIPTFGTVMKNISRVPCSLENPVFMQMCRLKSFLYYGCRFILVARKPAMKNFLISPVCTFNDKKAALMKDHDAF